MNYHIQPGESPRPTKTFEALLHLAEEQGYLTANDVLREIPEPEDHVHDLETIFLRLVARGIEVYSDAEEAHKAIYEREKILMLFATR